MHGTSIGAAAGGDNDPPPRLASLPCDRHLCGLGAAVAAALALGALALGGGAGAASSCTASIGPGTAAPGDMLLAVTGAPDRAVAAGIHFDGGTGRPLVVRADGDTANRIPIPVDPGAGTIQLQDAVMVGDRTWAVGSLHNDTPMAGWLQRDRWRWSEPIDPGGVEDELLGVAALPDGTLWAVGKYRTGANYQPLVERFDGHGLARGGHARDPGLGGVEGCRRDARWGRVGGRVVRA